MNTWMNKTIFIKLTVIVLILMFLYGCAAKSARKNVADLSIGDSKELAVEFWGEPDVIIPSSDLSSGRELWIYECLQFFDCTDSNCYFVTPCYYLYFQNNAIVSIYEAVVW